MLEKSVKDCLFFDNIVPTHNGVAAVHIFNSVACAEQGKIVVANGEGYPTKFSKYHIENRIVKKKRLVKDYGKLISMN